MSTTLKFTGAELRFLRGLGHELSPVVQIGKDGITDGVVKAATAALLKHELAKFKVLSEAPVERIDAAGELAEKADATLVQVLGRTFLLYRRHPKTPKIKLPAAKKAKKSAPRSRATKTSSIG